MKAISLWQPWASLWLTRHKIHETRHWPTKHRGWLLVHAARHAPESVDADLAVLVEDEFGKPWARDLPRGAIIGAVDLTGCIPTENVSTTEEDRLCGNFAPGRYGWRRGAFVVLGTPVLWIGRQRIFNVDSVAIQREIARLAAQ